MSAETKWTPGPWSTEREFADSPFNDRVVADFDSDDEVVIVRAGGDMNPEADEANLQIIAAAPDLYEALAGLVLVADGDHCACGDPRCASTRDAWASARAALARARGETP